MWINRQVWNNLKARTDALLNTLAKVQDQATLIGIERVGRVNKFTFTRNGKVVEIETMGLISDDLPEWKEKLLR